MTTEELPTVLATQLVQEWATDRLTTPTPAERDLARWIVERIDEDPEMALARAALDSWWERTRHIQTALKKRAPTPGDVS